MWTARFDAVQIIPILFLRCSEEIKKATASPSETDTRERQKKKKVPQLEIYTPHVVRSDSTGLR